jgi:D-cysteine desulfhydrase
VNDTPRLALGHWPTPLAELDRLSRHLGGPRLWVKRDDLSGLAGGGNKTRKLEYLLADARARGAATLITAGAAQSNHARQTAAAAARCGFGCVLVLTGTQPAAGSVAASGNLLLDRLLGARIEWAGDRDAYTVMQEVAAAERVAGREPYVIPYGGSNAIGAGAYVEAMDELARQALRAGVTFDHIVVASGSGGTQAGMVAGARAANLRSRILGVSVGRPAAPLAATVLDLARLSAAYLNLRIAIDADAVAVTDAYTGDGYGVPGDAEREAIRLAARTEGLLLDPVYTGRAMAGLIDLAVRGEFGRHETVLFWHTGGQPALYAYGEELLR